MKSSSILDESTSEIRHIERSKLQCCTAPEKSSVNIYMFESFDSRFLSKNQLKTSDCLITKMKIDQCKASKLN